MADQTKQGEKKTEATTKYVIEWFDYRNITPREEAEIKNVYEVAFRDDIGLIFDAKIDADFVEPLKYYSPEVNGAYLVVRRQDESKTIVGTAALRPLADLKPVSVELKRMFLLPEARGLGLSKTTMSMLLGKARELKYERIVLDTKLKLEAANKLYEKNGFTDCERYNDNPRPDRFMALML